ncbi:hypothetical protein ACM66B_004899 [Microbotryomycetes sp. NB124-2]
MPGDKRDEPPLGPTSSHSTLYDHDKMHAGTTNSSAVNERNKSTAASPIETPQSPTLIGGQPLRQYCTAEAIPAVELDQHDESCERRQQRTDQLNESGKDADEDDDGDEEKSERTVVDKGEIWDDYPDGGRAWLVVLGAALFCCTQMAYGLTWGVWLATLKSGPHKDVELSVLNLVVGLSNFLMAVTSFAAGRCGEVFGFKRVLIVNVVLTYAVQLTSAFVYKSIVGLFIAQGALLGIVMGLGLPLYLSIPSQWFKKRRGVATGLCAGGSGFGGALFSLIIRAMLPKLGYRKTMIIYATINFTLCCIGWMLLKERKVPRRCGDECKKSRNWLPAGIWRRPTFYSFEVSIFVAVFGFLTPFYYLTSYTTLKCPELDPQSILPAVPLIVANLAGCFGRVGSGFLADKFGPVNALWTTFFLGGLLQCIMWPFTESYGSILAFAVLQGAVGNWFMSLIPVVAAQLFGVQGLATIVGFTVLVNSPGQLAGASVSGIVLSRSGGNYQAVAWYAGGVMILGSIILLYARFAHEKRILARY